MTSSSFCELIVRQGKRVLGAVSARAGERTRLALADFRAQGNRPIEVELLRAEGRRSVGRVLAGSRLCLVLPPLRSRGLATLSATPDEFGEISLRYIESPADDPEISAVLLELSVEIAARPALRALYGQLIEELEKIHIGLARDVLGGRGSSRGKGGGAGPRMIQPVEDHQALEQLHQRLEPALECISRQPMRGMAQEIARARWRPGDRIVAGAASEALRESDSVIEGGRLVSIGRIMVRRARLTFDISEHRQIRAGLVILARKAEQLAAHCERFISLLEAERRRWGGRRREAGTSVFETEYLPRIEAYQFLASRAAELGRRFAELERRHEFLTAARTAPVGLRPTPLFLNAPGYREAFQVLREVEGRAGPMVSGEELRIHFRSLSRIYEYWCFIAVVEICRGLFGEPLHEATYQVIDEIYRPDLTPGQTFRFHLPARKGAPAARISVTYEPDILPLGWSQHSPLVYRATLSEAPLRPDILVELERPGAPPELLVLDAKSRRQFQREDLWKPTDYRARIFDPASGRQPLRQVFFLHLDAHNPEMVNLPGFLQGEHGSAHSSVLGAIYCAPGNLERLERVLARFLEIHRG